MKRLLIVLSLILPSLVANAVPPPPGSANATPIDDYTLVLILLGILLAAFHFGRTAAKKGFRI